LTIRKRKTTTEERRKEKKNREKTFELGGCKKKREARPGLLKQGERGGIAPRGS